MRNSAECRSGKRQTNNWCNVTLCPHDRTNDTAPLWHRSVGQSQRHDRICRIVCIVSLLMLDEHAISFRWPAPYQCVRRTTYNEPDDRQSYSHLDMRVNNTFSPLAICHRRNSIRILRKKRKRETEKYEKLIQLDRGHE